MKAKIKAYKAWGKDVVNRKVLETKKKHAKGLLGGKTKDLIEAIVLDNSEEGGEKVYKG